jgi:hypothetical protein
MAGPPREIFDCRRVRDYLDSYLQGQVPPPEARAMRLHFHACPDCQPLVLARDPVQLFSALSDEGRSEEFWVGFWPAVRAAIHAAEVEEGSWRARLFRPAYAWGAAAAMLLLAVLALLGPWQAPSPPAQEAPAVLQAASDGWQEVLPSAGRIGEPSLPTVEEVRSPSAKVLSMKVFGEGEAVTEVVLIVDEGIQL